MTRAVPNRQIAEEAADWAVRIDAGPLEAHERRALADWLKASPVHVDELVYCASVLGGLQGVDRDRRLSIDDYLAEGAAEAIPLHGEQARSVAMAGAWAEGHGARVAYPKRLALAASLALVAALGFVLFRPPWGGALSETALDLTVRTYTTDLGEQRSVTLADGSVIFLNTRSRVGVRLSPTERRIDLLQGEALFEVAHDASRPFRVYADGTVTEAVGTKFNVRQTPTGIRVVVVEGKVLVDSRVDGRRIRRHASAQPARPAPIASDQALVVAGQQAQLSAVTGLPVVENADIVAATSWRMRQLSFDGASLDQIVAEFNRYNPTTIVVADPSLNQTRLSGVFDANDPNSFVAFLELSARVEVDRSTHGLIVLNSRSGRENAARNVR